ncbi:MAG: LysR family transcriptional regulator, partial [Comamonadaceae bacterium]
MPNAYHVEMRQLQYFVAVAEELSFTRAAARLHVSQPPVSRQVMLLEESLGVRLFERSKQYVRLTVAGEHFHREAREILASLKSAVHSTQQVAHVQLAAHARHDHQAHVDLAGLQRRLLVGQVDRVQHQFDLRVQLPELVEHVRQDVGGAG